MNTRQSVNLYRHLKALQKEVTFYLIEGADHGGAEFWTPETIDIMVLFIQRCLKRQDE